jgi:hypothetical protein
MIQHLQVLCAIVMPDGSASENVDAIRDGVNAQQGHCVGSLCIASIAGQL